ncbi:hypothetical protein SLI_3583 [Streptomyces lividans 1326]|uniref:Uncharacterized protein n=1 Tax=Streptomyces lividans 1326 TaxID=1200984 RepID=A0A7U9HD19_STRLI|nr:hypothetical protein SLI_3583 [Streptomyces lividans 1326]
MHSSTLQERPRPPDLPKVDCGRCRSPDVSCPCLSLALRT